MDNRQVEEIEQVEQQEHTDTEPQQKNEVVREKTK